jgi:hypothetical protein
MRGRLKTAAAAKARRISPNPCPAAPPAGSPRASSISDMMLAARIVCTTLKPIQRQETEIHLPQWEKMMPEIAWGKKVSGPFKTKVLAISSNLGCDPSHLMAAMAFETGETFSPSVRNKASGATGLIQFMPSTAKALGTTTSQLASMTDVEQLDFVAKYLKPFKNKMSTVADVYMTILFPKAVGKPAAFVLFAKPSKAYAQNAGLDANKDGAVTKDEAAAKVQAKLVKGLGASLRG